MERELDDDLPPIVPLSGRHAISRHPTLTTQVETHGSEPGTLPNRKSLPSSMNHCPTIPGYDIVGILGRGGMGIVYRALDVQLGREVAIKVMAPSLASPKFRQRFETEAKSLAMINHVGVTKIFEFGFVEDCPFLVMELIDGKTLSQIAENRPMEPTAAAKWVVQLTESLQACHDQNVVHRDVKPDNIIVASNGIAKLTDFGIAKQSNQDEMHRLTSTGEIMGTPAYMSPEQASGIVKTIGAATDVYSAGAVLYELLTGRPPFTSHDPLQIVLMVLSRNPIAPRVLQPKIPQDLENVVLKSLEKKPSNRYSSCADFSRDLVRFLRGEPVQAKPIPWRRKAVFWVKQHPLLASITCLFFVLIGSALGALSAHNSRLKTELDRTKRLVDNGRNLSRWLLIDFSNSIANDEGPTKLQAQLAEKTKDYLEGMRNESQSDRDLRMSLAESWILLAELQGGSEIGSFGRDQEANRSLEIAESLLTGNETHPLFAFTKIRWLLIKTGVDRLDPNKLKQVQESLAQIRSMLADADLKIEEPLRKDIERQTDFIDLKLALSEGNFEKLKSLSQKIEQATLPWGDPSQDGNRLLDRLTPLWQARAHVFNGEYRNGDLIEPLTKDLERIRDYFKNRTIGETTRSRIATLERILADALYQDQKFPEALALYQSSLDSWIAVVNRDPHNQGALFNVGSAACYLGETLTQLSRFEEAEKALDQAQNFYARYASCNNKSLEEYPETIYLLGAFTTLWQKKGRLDEAISTVEKQVKLLEKFSVGNAEYRSALGDALAISAMLRVEKFLDQFNSSQNESTESIEKGFEQIFSHLDLARIHFEQMERDNVINERDRANLQRMIKTRELLEAEKDNLQNPEDNQE